MQVSEVSLKQVEKVQVS